MRTPWSKLRLASSIVILPGAFLQLWDRQRLAMQRGPVVRRGIYCAAYLPCRLGASNAYWHWLNVGSTEAAPEPGRLAQEPARLGRGRPHQVRFEPWRAFFYAIDEEVKWTDLFDRFLDGEVLCLVRTCR